MQSSLAACGSFIFWSVLAIFYLCLAIVVYITSKPILKKLSIMVKEGDSITWGEKGEEIGLESLLNRAFKVIYITDIVGFILASGAAILSLYMR